MLKKTPFLLLIIAMLRSIADLQGQMLPQFNAPIGISNEYDFCYGACFLQLLNAIRHTAPDVFEKVIVNNHYNMLHGYLKTLTNNIFVNPHRYRGFAVQRHILDPGPFTRAFVEASPTRMQSMVFEERHLANGTIEKVNRGPWREKARTGTVHEVMKAFLEQWNSACKNQAVHNPFEFCFAIQGGNTRLCHWVLLAELCNACVTDECGITTVNLSHLLPHQSHVLKYPQFLIAINSDETRSFTIPVLLETTDSVTKDVVTYNLLAVAYGFPVLSENKGFVGNHCVAIVRYGSVWYLCDDENITPFVNEQAAYNWIATAREFSYSGPGLPSHACSIVVPDVVIYTTDGSEQN